LISPAAVALIAQTGNHYRVNLQIDPSSRGSNHIAPHRPQLRRIQRLPCREEGKLGEIPLETTGSRLFTFRRLFWDQSSPPGLKAVKTQ
jgi:hypothetical protein